MELLQLFVVVTVTYISATDALSCKQCSYAELPKKLTDAGLDSSFTMFGTDENCKTGSTSLDSDSCDDTLLSGNKRVCVSAKAKVTMKVSVADESASMGMTVYSRSCEQIDSTEYPDDEGSAEIDHFEEDIQSLFSDINESGIPGLTMSVTLKKFSAGVAYCTTENCGATDDISKLSGSAHTLLPSTVMVVVLTVLVSVLSV